MLLMNIYFNCFLNIIIYFIQFRSTHALTPHESLYWRYLYTAVKSEIKYVMKVILPHIATNLKLSLEPLELENMNSRHINSIISLVEMLQNR